MSLTTLMSFAEFEQLPDMPGKQELLDGELIAMPPPERKHTNIAKTMYELLRAKLPKSRLWPDRTGYRIGDGWIEPDASVTWPDQKHDEKYLRGAPMIAIEILSQGEEIDRKLTLYFAEGALVVWLIDPRHRSLTVYCTRGGDVIRTDVPDTYYSDSAQVSVALDSLFEEG
jgi:Uma2 family endonuclease